MIMLSAVDRAWKDHLYSMDHLREGIGMRGYAQLDPIVEYKREGYEMFSDMIGRIKEEVLQYLFRFQIKSADGRTRAFTPQKQGTVPEPQGEVPSRKQLKVGRNDPCPCGSGKKFKKCCGRSQ